MGLGTASAGHSGIGEGMLGTASVGQVLGTVSAGLLEGGLGTYVIGNGGVDTLCRGNRVISLTEGRGVRRTDIIGPPIPREFIIDNVPYHAAKCIRAQISV